MTQANQNNIKDWITRLQLKTEQVNILQKWLQEFIEQHHPSKQEIETGCAIAEHCVNLHLDLDCICVAIAFPCIKTQSQLNSTKPIQLESCFNAEQKKLISASLTCCRIDDIEWDSNFANSEKHKRQARHLLLALAEDMRTIPVLLARRLVELVNARDASQSTQKSLATHTKHLYAPLANRLGFGDLKWQLEDYCLLYSEPKIYKQLADELDLRRDERDTFLREISNNLIEHLKEENIQHHNISGRSKHLNSIYLKMQKKNIPLQQLYDRLAIRILVPTIRDCYRTLSIVHQHWRHHPEEFDDYVANPKPNGYRSIHTVIFYQDKHPVEVQIRTHEMHESSEYGAAAHWAYKEGHDANTQDQQRIQSLRKMLDWQSELQNDDPQNQNAEAEFIYVFTPKGNIVELPRGSTGLDFAYHIHTQVGHKCRGVKINQKLSPLTQHLRTGDHVEVVTGKEQRPSRDWLREELGYIKTSNAKHRITQWFRSQHQDENMHAGQIIWERFAKKNNLQQPDLKKLCDLLHIKRKEDLFVALNKGEIGLQTCLNRLKPKSETDLENEHLNEASIAEGKTTTSSGGVKTSNINELLHSLGRCCSPLPGDEIMGYITRGRGVTIHRTDCHHIKTIQQDSPERLLSVSWHQQTNKHNFRADLQIQAHHNDHILRDISTALATEKITLLSARTKMKKSATANTAIIDCQIQVKDQDQLKKAIQCLSNIPEIIDVQRKSAASS